MKKINGKVPLFAFILSFELVGINFNSMAMINWNFVSSIGYNEKFDYLTSEQYETINSKKIGLHRNLTGFLISKDFVYMGINGLPIRDYYSCDCNNDLKDENKILVPSNLEENIPIHPILLFMQNLKEKGITLYKDDRFNGEDVSYKIYDKDGNMLYYDFEKQECGFVSHEELEEIIKSSKFGFLSIEELPRNEKRVYLFINSLLPSFVKSFSDNPEFLATINFTENPNDSSSYSSLVPHGLTL